MSEKVEKKKSYRFFLKVTATVTKSYPVEASTEEKAKQKVKKLFLHECNNFGELEDDPNANIYVEVHHHRRTSR
jgi:hypothetical protein